MKTLRLLITEKCNKSCEGCCNKQWDLNLLPVVTEEELYQYDEILITGGEPTADIDALQKIGLMFINRDIKAKKYLYTNGFDPYMIYQLLKFVFDGITYTLHEQDDVTNFEIFCQFIQNMNLDKKSLRLNVFKDVVLPDIDLSKWTIKKDMIWIENCPLPSNEVFKRI